MKIILTDSKGNKFTQVENWNQANVAAKAIFKRQYWSDLYYEIFFDSEDHICGSIDLEPESFHKPHQSTLFTQHVKTFWTNISKLKPNNMISSDDIKCFTKLLNILNTTFNNE